MDLFFIGLHGPDILFYYNAQLIGRNPDTSGLYVLDWKGLDVNTPILTADGWTSFGDDIQKLFLSNGLEGFSLVLDARIEHVP